MSDIISRKDVLSLADRGVLISNGNYKSVCEAINNLPSISERDAVKLIWSAQVDELVGKIDKLEVVHLGTMPYLRKQDVMKILLEAKE